MATYLFSTLQNNQRIEFDPAIDVFRLDDPSLSAAQLQYAVPDGIGDSISFTHQGKTVVLAGSGLLGRITLELPEEHLALTAAAEQAEAALQAERLEKKRNRRGRSSRDAQPDGDTSGESEGDSDSEGGGGEA